MKFIHYSHERLASLHPCCYLQGISIKPAGFWVSVEERVGPDDSLTWKAFCEMSAFDLEGLRYAHDVKFSEDARLLVLKTIEQMYHLSKVFAVPALKGSQDILWIDWQSVSERYQGVVIAPYHFSLRLVPGFEWYYPWDVASGCIWDLDAIACITPVLGGC